MLVKQRHCGTNKLSIMAYSHKRGKQDGWIGWRVSAVETIKISDQLIKSLRQSAKIFFHDDSMIFLLQFSYNILISLFFLDSQSLQVTHDAWLMWNSLHLSTTLWSRLHYNSAIYHLTWKIWDARPAKFLVTFSRASSVSWKRRVNIVPEWLSIIKCFDCFLSEHSG